MSSNLDKLGDLLSEKNVTVADIEFIVNYLSNENISPQLAMRRIKSFDQLQKKLENSADKGKFEELARELELTKEKFGEVQEKLVNLASEKTGLESEKKQLESKSELLDSERDELRKQLQMLQEMQVDEPEKDRDLETRLSEFTSILEETMNTHKDSSDFIMPIKSHLSTILEDPNSVDFEKEAFSNTISGVINKFRENVKSEQPAATKTSTLTPAAAQILSQKPAKKEEPKKEPEKKEDKMDEYTKKTNQVLNLFIEFVTEAEDNDGFKERVSTICDMDEAYEYLGSIGLSQVYSFASKGIKKKEDLLKLLNSWKKDGVPR